MTLLKSLIIDIRIHSQFDYYSNNDFNIFFFYINHLQGCNNSGYGYSYLFLYNTVGLPLIINILHNKINLTNHTRMNVQNQV